MSAGYGTPGAWMATVDGQRWGVPQRTRQDAIREGEIARERHPTATIGVVRIVVGLNSRQRRSLRRKHGVQT